MSVVQGGFSRNRAPAAAGSNTNDKPKVQVWINIGYTIPGPNAGDDDIFVSLPTGIALDTMKPVSAKSNNTEYADFQAARNDMLTQFMEIAGQLKPGEATVYQAAGGLAIQIRRVQEEMEETVVNETNAFARDLFQAAG